MGSITYFETHNANSGHVGDYVAFGVLYGSGSLCFTTYVAISSSGGAELWRTGSKTG